MVDDRKKKVYVTTNNSTVTRLANRYKNANKQLKEIKTEREFALDSLRDIALGYFNPDDENNTRVLQTASVAISINKRTIRKVAKTDMEKVFESISEMFNIPREKLDKIVENNTTLIDTEIKPTLKVANL
jgi:hypothetical protein